MVHVLNLSRRGGPRGGTPDEAEGGVRSLVRGLDLLAALNERNPSTVTELTEATGLPKATVIRLLKTLCAEGYVARELAGEGYRLTPHVRRLSRALNRENALFHAARPVLYELVQRTLWPLQVLIAEGESMLIEVGTRQVAPLTIRGLDTTRFPILGSASGHVLLAWMAEAERAELLQRIARTSEPQAALAQDGAAIAREIALTRKRGYSARIWTAITNRLNIVAVPILAGERAVAALCLECLADAVGDDELERRFLPLLNDGAAAIARGLDQLEQTTGDRGQRGSVKG
ncbi:MAG: helix-turn-helix domain-containing protein [Candidatus Eiseniibacteriota bacterium]